MNILKRTQGIDLKAKSGVIRGDVCFQLKDDLTGKITYSEKHHNLLTNGLNNALNECPFGLNKVDTAYGTTGGSIFNVTPIHEQLLGGVILFPSTLGNDTDLLYPPFSNSPTGFASISAYSQEDSRQGTYDLVSSGVITNGFRHVFSWGSTYGNGTIASLGLSTRNAHTWCNSLSNIFKPWASGAATTGYVRARVSRTRLLSVTEKGTLIAYGTANYSGYNRIQFYKNLKPYSVGLLEDVRFDNMDVDNPYSNTNRNGYTWRNDTDIPAALGSIGPLQYTAQVIGDYLYINYHTGGSFTVKKLSLTDGTLVSTDTYTFTGDFGSGAAVLYGDYIYCGSSSANKILKCNINNVADVSEITASGLPANSFLFFVNTQFIYASVGILDAESDIFESIDSSITYALDQWFTYPVTEFGNWLIFNGGTNTCVTMKQWGLMTHYDLQNTVTKTADKQMIVQYSITQV